MEVGRFNYFKIKMELDLCPTREEKLSFLFSTKKDIRKVIIYFTSPKPLSLRYYARDDMRIEGNCEELKEFLKKVILKYSYDVRDSRYPGDDILNKEVHEEVKQYEKLVEMIDLEIEYVKSSSPKNEEGLLSA